MGWLNKCLNKLCWERVWLILMFLLSYGEEMDRQAIRQKISNYLTSHTGWTALNEIITQGTFPSLLLFGRKKRSCSSQIFIYSLNIIHFFAWPFFTFFHFIVGSQDVSLFSHSSVAQWSEMWFGCNLPQILLKDIWESSVVSGFLPNTKGRIRFFFFFILQLLSFPKDVLNFNDTVGLSAVQLLCHKVSCEALGATQTKQINHFCEAFERPLS